MEENDWGGRGIYDLNIYKQEDGRWKVDVYQIPETSQQTYAHLHGHFWLSQGEAKRLTLGVSEADGGAYGDDEDFVIDTQGFLEVYGDRVSEVLLSVLSDLPTYTTPKE